MKIGQRMMPRDELWTGVVVGYEALDEHGAQDGFSMVKLRVDTAGSAPERVVMRFRADLIELPDSNPLTP